MKEAYTMFLIVLGICTLSGCSDSEIVTQNIKKDAGQFKVLRRTAFMNNITGKYLFEAEGNCLVETSNEAARLELTCKAGEDKCKVHYFELPDNTNYIVEQMEWKEENKYKYKIIFKPESVIPLEVDTE